MANAATVGSLITRIDPAIAATPVDWGLPPKFKAWRPGQFEVVMRSIDTDKRHFAICSPTGCVAGDTIIGINRGGNGGSMRIDEAYRQSQRFYTTWKIRSLKEDLNWIGSHPVQEFVYSGKKYTWLLVLMDGRSIRATPEHLIKTTRGWVKLSKLQSDDEVVCEQHKLPYGRTEKKRKPIYSQTQGLLYHKYAGGACSNRTRPRRPGGKLMAPPEGRLYRVAKHRLVYEAHLNGLSLEEFIKICRTDQKRARTLQFLDPSKISVHHKDEDYMNNGLDNLIALSYADHCREHGIKSAFKHFGIGFVETVGVWKVMPFGLEDTYDVICADPYRNFVGNGIVVHNSGKSLIYSANAVITGRRTGILVITKALQDQLLRDFASIGMVDVRGSANYDCKLSGSDGALNCEEGSHARCKYAKTTSCPRTAALERARSAPLFVTNYHFWCLANQYGKGLGTVDHLVLDEAHGAPEALAGIVESEITERQCKLIGVRWPSGPLSIDVWRVWASTALGQCMLRVEQHRSQMNEALRISLKSVRDMSKLTNLERKLALIVKGGMTNEPWEWEQTKYGYKFAPLWPREFAEEYLYRGVPHITWVSATVRPKTLDLGGVKVGEYEFLETPSTFSPKRMPVYHLPTIACKYTNTDFELRTLYKRIDQILESRSDRKALIHSVSYKRMQEIVIGSKFAHRMIAPDTEELAREIGRFKRKREESGAALISPSITTGYDFPYTDAEVNIIPKLPFPDSRSKIQKARQDADPEYAPYQMMQTLVQECGRPSRADDDRSETMILDDQIVWAIKKYRKHVPQWFYRTNGYSGTQTGGMYIEIERKFAGHLPPLPPVPPKLIDPRPASEREIESEMEESTNMAEALDDDVPF